MWSLPRAKFTEPQDAFLERYMLANLSCLLEQRLNNCIKYSSLVVHHLKIIGENQNYDIQQCSNLTQPYRRQIEETFIDVPYVAITLMETLLAIDRSERQTASSAFKSERRQDRSNSKSKSEYFTRNKDDIVSTFPIESPRLSHYSKDSIDDSEPPQPPMPESYYGPLIADSWTKSTKNYDDVSTTSRADLSSLSGLLSSGYRNTPKISVTWENVTSA
ncbi:hypothetical protein L2E82_40874 [Cichorium intybus]|uniref:Uncharacterized protein n=1 Tax=Cichorium intybus TaxID=13427 RepID=A0ACB9AM78_CICIN|nr:hypothetical protein L2E82_40874 [Cichorium intybus]